MEFINLCNESTYNVHVGHWTFNELASDATTLIVRRCTCIIMYIHVHVHTQLLTVNQVSFNTLRAVNRLVVSLHNIPSIRAFATC